MANDDRSIGALWVKNGPKGQFFSGYVEIDGVKTDIVAFNNTNNQNPKAPAIRILKGMPRQTQEQGTVTGDDVAF